MMRTGATKSMAQPAEVKLDANGLRGYVILRKRWFSMYSARGSNGRAGIGGVLRWRPSSADARLQPGLAFHLAPHYAAWTLSQGDAHKKPSFVCAEVVPDERAGAITFDGKHTYFAGRLKILRVIPADRSVPYTFATHILPRGLRATEDNSWQIRWVAKFGTLGELETLEHNAGQPLPPVTIMHGLRAAAQHGRCDMIGRFLHYTETDLGDAAWDVLAAASKNGHIGAVSMLLKDGRFDPSANRYSALRYTSSKPCVRLIVSDPRLGLSHEMKLEVMSAVGSSYEIMDDVIEFLIVNRDTPSNKNGNYLLECSAMRNSTVILESLLAHPSIRPQDSDALVLALETKCLDAARLLIRDGRSSIDAETFLSGIVEQNNVSAARFLLEESAVDPSVNNGEALFIAIGYYYDAMTRLLLDDARVDPCARGLDIFKGAVDGWYASEVTDLWACVRMVAEHPRVKQFVRESDDHDLQVLLECGDIETFCALIEDRY